MIEQKTQDVRPRLQFRTTVVKPNTVSALKNARKNIQLSQMASRWRGSRMSYSSESVTSDEKDYRPEEKYEEEKRLQEVSMEETVSEHSEGHVSPVPVFGHDQLIEFAGGKVGPLFGPQFQLIDAATRTVQLPTATRRFPYVSRVTKMHAQSGFLTPGSSMTVEYDLPQGPDEVSTSSLKPGCLIETGKNELLLFTYLLGNQLHKLEGAGCSYRLLDASYLVHELPQSHGTLTFSYKMKSFTKRKNGDVHLCFFEYSCHQNGHLVMEMKNGVGGFLSPAEASTTSIRKNSFQVQQKKSVQKQSCAIDLEQVISQLDKTHLRKEQLSEEDIQLLCDGKWKEALGKDYGLSKSNIANNSLTLPIKSVPFIRATHGSAGLGLVVAELEANAALLEADSILQCGSSLMQLYLMWLGLMDVFKGDVQANVPLPYKWQLRSRGKSSTEADKFLLLLEVKELVLDEDTDCPRIVADVSIVGIDESEKGGVLQWDSDSSVQDSLQNLTAATFITTVRGMALDMEGTRKAPAPEATIVSPVKEMTSLESKQKPRYLVPIPWNCLKGDMNPPTEVIWHPLFSLLKEAHKKNPEVLVPQFHPSEEIQPRPILHLPFLKGGQDIRDVVARAASGPVALEEVLNDIDLNFEPGTFPLNFCNLCEFQLGNISRCMGEAFEMLDISRTSRSPSFELAFLTRAVKVTGTKMKGSKIDPSCGVIYTEFDCPADAWFFDSFKSNFDSSNPARYKHVPYYLLMEMALQSTGVLSNHLEASLALGTKDVLFRNLDATSKMTDAIKKIDFRGKTIINKTTCMSFHKMGNMVIQRFRCELYVKERDSEKGNGNLQNYLETYEKESIEKNEFGCFYECESSFGWFSPERFVNQAGLDGGKKTKPLYLADAKLKKEIVTYPDVHLPKGKAAFVLCDSKISATDAKIKRDLLRKPGKNDFLEEINMSVSTDPTYQYVHGKRAVKDNAWYFSCHFWNDPVMPGSLGIETMYQLVEYYAIQKKLYEQLHVPEGKKVNFRFQHCAAENSWKYRGQVVREDNAVDTEVFIKSVELKEDGKVVEITADGSFYVDNLRVDEGKGLKLQLTYYVCQEQGPAKVDKKEEPRVPRVTRTEVSEEALRTQLLDLSKEVNVAEHLGKLYEYKAVDESVKVRSPDFGTVFPMELSSLGDKSFKRFYGVRANLYSGAMAKGIASDSLVIAMGKENLLGCFGAGGLPLQVVEKALLKIKASLQNRPFAVNLIHSPLDPSLEEGNVNLFIKNDVKIVEASAFMNLTASVVQYRANGLRVAETNPQEIIIDHKLITKCSRTEVASAFLQPAPLKMLDSLLSKGKITPLQHKLAQLVPVADDVTVEADSGGHTDNRPVQVILPLVISLRNKLQKALAAKLKTTGADKQYSAVTYSYNSDTGKDEKVPLRWPMRVRVGAAGGIGCPEAALCAFNLGAAYVVTGTVNQMACESGSSEIVRTYLSKASYSDITMAPAGDMFDQGVQLQVLKKSTMFPSRAKKLYEVFCKYDSLEAIPKAELKSLEKRVFKKSVQTVWEETKSYYTDVIRDTTKIIKVEQGDQKLKMSLCFRWYLGLSSFWAKAGTEERKADYQIWCGPAIGAFNDFIKGSYLDPQVSGTFPSVADVNLEILKGAAYLARVNQLQTNRDIGIDIFERDLSWYKPEKPIRQPA